MSGRLIELEDRVAQWLRAYDAVRREVTPDALRATLAAMEEVDGVSELSSYLDLARNVMANDRTAATVAATLVVNGVRPPGSGYDPE
jgi:hypothetical protein